MRKRAAILLALALGASAHAGESSVEVVELAKQRALVITVRAKPEALEGALSKAFFQLVAAAQRHGVTVDGPPFARYLSRGTAKDPTIIVEAGLAFRGTPSGTLAPSIRAVTLPAGPAATLEHRGRYQDLPDAHAALDRWLAGHKRTTAGPRWEVYITNPVTTPDPARQQTRIVAPLHK